MKRRGSQRSRRGRAVVAPSTSPRCRLLLGARQDRPGNHRDGVTVTVPALAPGRYLVLVTSTTGMLDSYSQPVTITP